MRLVGLELRNYRCFEHLDLDLDETTVIVGANDTGKSAILEAIDGLLEPGGVDWEAVHRTGATGPSMIVGRFCDLAIDKPFSLAAFIVGDTIRIGVSSDHGREHYLVVTPDQARVVQGLLDLDEAQAAIDAGTVEPGFNTGVTVETPAGRGFLVPVVDLEFNAKDWGILDVWEGEGGIGPIRAVHLGSASDSRWDPVAVLRPILERHLAGDIDSSVSRAMEALEDQVDDLLGRLSRSHSGALRTSSAYRWIRWHAVASLADQVIDGLVADLSLDPAGPEGVQAAEETPAGASRRMALQLALLRSPTPTLVDLGPGTQRSVALAALELYRDPDLWPLGGTVILLVEEPETGMHPEAQRRAAALLRALATFGLQLVVVTHSPAFINAAPPAGVRLATKTLDDDKTELRRTIARPVGLAELRHELGIKPSDILLAQRFVVVEGESDRAILVAWARRIGIDLEAEGVQLIPSGGYSSADRVSQFLALAYEGADFVVVLDNGAQANKTRMEIDARFGNRVMTVVLSRTDIEGFFSPASITAWLLTAGAAMDGLEHAVRERLAAPKGGRIAALDSLARTHLRRSYQKLGDGLAVALATSESDLDPEVKALLTGLSSSGPTA